jgi:hypothetical protein
MPLPVFMPSGRGVPVRLSRATAKLREQLAAIDATLRMFCPDVDPDHITLIRPFNVRNVWVRRGEQTRLVFEAMRDIGQPLPFRLIAEYVMRAKGVERDDAGMWLRGREHVRVALRRVAEHGMVRKIIGGAGGVGEIRLTARRNEGRWLILLRCQMYGAVVGAPRPCASAQNLSQGCH